MYKKMKITKYLAMLAAAATMTVACQKEEFATFNPENVVAPVLHAVEDIVVTVDNKSQNATFTWDAADFGVKAQIYYSLDMSKGDVTVSLFSGISGTSANVSLDNINNKAFNDLGIASGEAGEVVFTLGAKLNVGETYYSEPVTAKVTPTAAEKVYEKMWVVGSYNGWAHDTSNQFLFNYAEDGVTFTGVIDFGEDHSANEFKITGGGWGIDEFSATGTNGEEAATVTLVAGGGDNITSYKAARYYHLSFDKNAPSLSKISSFSQVGVIGLGGDWNNDIVMSFSAAKQKFYVDVEVAEATEFKFRMDGGWDFNLGGDMKALSNGGDNIKIEAGNYRIYLDMNNKDAMNCTLDTKAYGTEEGGSAPVEPEEPENPELPEGARPITVLCEATGWDVTNLYGWGGKLSFSWPGEAAAGVATLCGAEYSYWTLDAANWGATGVGLIFNNGSVQTVDIANVTLDGDKCFRVGEAGADGKLGYEELALPSIRITYKNEAGWDAVSIYGWGDLGDFGGWPGQAMTKEGDVWVYDIPVEHLGKSTSLIFNNAGAGAQTVDLGPFTLEGDMMFDNSNAAIK